MTDVQYQRPVKAKLVVRLDNGEEFEATAADFAKFNLVSRADVYKGFRDGLTQILEVGGYSVDPTEAAVNILRHLVEQTVRWGEPVNLKGNGDDREMAAEILMIEEALRAAWGGINAPEQQIAAMAERVEASANAPEDDRG